MAVEAAVGQVGRLHDVGDADAVESLLAKQRAGRVDNAFAILVSLLPAHSHGFTLMPRLSYAAGSLTNYMTTVMNKQVVNDGYHLTAIATG